MRLFIAIELADTLKRALAELRSDIPGVRWVAPDQIHLTLAFLGETAAETADLLISDLAALQAMPFLLTLSGMGCFPNRHQPRVLWVGVVPEPALTLLASRIDAVLRAHAIPREERPFAPHITLARCRPPCPQELGPYLHQHRQVSFHPVPVTEFTLFESRLSQQGALHLPLQSFPLMAKS